MDGQGMGMGDVGFMEREDEGVMERRDEGVLERGDEVVMERGDEGVMGRGDKGLWCLCRLGRVNVMKLDKLWFSVIVVVKWGWTDEN